MAETLLRIVDAFAIRGRGVAIVGTWADPNAGHVIRIGDAIAIARADGSRLRTTIQRLELFTTPPRQQDQVGIILGPEVRREDVAAGDEVIRVDGSGDPG